MDRNTVPTLDTVATAAGVALSIVVAIGGLLFGFPAIATLCGVAAGGYLAGRMARRDGLFHGLIVAALTIVAVDIVASAGQQTVNDILADTLTIVVSDVLLLLLGCAGGWLSTRR